jgi:hypothetical protein
MKNNINELKKYYPDEKDLSYSDKKVIGVFNEKIETLVQKDNLSHDEKLDLISLMRSVIRIQYNVISLIEIASMCSQTYCLVEALYYADWILELCPDNLHCLESASIVYFKCGLLDRSEQCVVKCKEINSNYDFVSRMENSIRDTRLMIAETKNIRYLHRKK